MPRNKGGRGGRENAKGNTVQDSVDVSLRQTVQLIRAAGETSQAVQQLIEGMDLARGVVEVLGRERQLRPDREQLERMCFAWRCQRAKEVFKWVNLTVTYKTAEEWRGELERAEVDFPIGTVDWIERIHRPEWDERHVRLLAGTRAEFGLPKCMLVSSQISDRARELGLSLCPPLVALYLATESWTIQDASRWYVATEPIIRTDGAVSMGYLRFRPHTRIEVAEPNHICPTDNIVLCDMEGRSW